MGNWQTVGFPHVTQTSSSSPGTVHTSSAMIAIPDAVQLQSSSLPGRGITQSRGLSRSADHVSGVTQSATMNARPTFETGHSQKKCRAVGDPMVQTWQGAHSTNSVPIDMQFRWLKSQPPTFAARQVDSRAKGTCNPRMTLMKSRMQHQNVHHRKPQRQPAGTDLNSCFSWIPGYNLSTS